jgi:hypothetical protein
MLLYLIKVYDVMIKPNSAPSVEDPNNRQDQLDDPAYRQDQLDDTELVLAEIVLTTRPEVIQTELLLRGGSIAIGALLDQLVD